MRSRDSKYHAKKVTFDGITFDSKREGMRYLYLKDLESNGEISDLRLQVRYEIVPAVYSEETVQLKTKQKTIRKCVQRPITYVADFVYQKDGKTIVEDSKGFKTKEYMLKKKLMKALLGIDITETR